MPELPDIELYLEALDSRIRGDVLEKIHFGSPFLLRSVTPTPSALISSSTSAASGISP